MNKYFKKAAALLLSVLLVIPVGISALSETTSALKIRPMQLPDELSSPDTQARLITARISNGGAWRLTVRWDIQTRRSAR